ncbi:HAD family hydrolase [Streptomyces sp. NPDC058620]|uniref:HAD family hydrolase n=1 Tax=Streptomyces sp. NPDC058620 TaxID=3346560 RepID=UPI003659C8CD
MLCDLDNVIRFYDTTELAALERVAGLAEGTTMDIAYAPEVDLPLLLGRITTDEWVTTIASRLAGRPTGPATHAPVTPAEPHLHAPTPLTEPQAYALGHALARAPFRADEAVVALLRRVRDRLPLVLVTNASDQLEEDLASLGIDDLADHVVSSAREGVAKPDPAIYVTAAARAGVPVKRCLFVDDRRENVDAAVALGMTGVLYRELADLYAPLSAALEGGGLEDGGQQDGGQQDEAA